MISASWQHYLPARILNIFTSQLEKGIISDNLPDDGGMPLISLVNKTLVTHWSLSRTKTLCSSLSASLTATIQHYPQKSMTTIRNLVYGGDGTRLYSTKLDILMAVM